MDTNHECYLRTGVPVPVLPPMVRPQHTKDTWYISVSMSVEDFIYLVDVLPKCSTTTEEIYRRREFCDLNIICDDGTIIPCHKAFLSGMRCLTYE